MCAEMEQNISAVDETKTTVIADKERMRKKGYISDDNERDQRCGWDFVWKFNLKGWKLKKIEIIDEFFFGRISRDGKRKYVWAFLSTFQCDGREIYRFHSLAALIQNFK